MNKEEYTKLENEYLAIMDKTYLDSLASVGEILGLDEVAYKELQGLVQSTNFTKETFTNTYKLWMEEDTLVEYMKLIVGMEQLKNEFLKEISVIEDKVNIIVGHYDDDFASKTSQLSTNFIEFYREDILRMQNESLQRSIK